MESEQKLHPIFLCDPEEWLQYVYKQVSVVTEDEEEHVGWVYTIDPVSQSFVLASFHDDKTQISILINSSITKVTILAESLLTIREKLDALCRPKSEDSLSEEELIKKRKNLKVWLEKNRLPVQVTGSKDEVLTISDVLTIHPPYQVENCHSTNEIVLGRIQALIKNMPADQE